MENPFIIETGEQTYIPTIVGVINRAALIAAINRNDPRETIARLSDPNLQGEVVPMMRFRCVVYGRFFSLEWEVKEASVFLCPEHRMAARGVIGTQMNATMRHYGPRGCHE